MPRSSKPSVTILGGGVAGLSAAQELLERGFHVAVYEKKHWGGKVRGMPVPGSGTGGRRDLPGQHGFHFFPGFYKNLPDTMKRIPSVGGKTVFEHVVTSDEELLARSVGPSAKVPARMELTWSWLKKTIDALGALTSGLTTGEIALLATRLAAYAATCRERREHELDDVSWWSYVEAEHQSELYQRLAENLPTELLIAVKPRRASTRTIADAAIQMASYAFVWGRTSDRLLDGPEEDVWVQPWVEHLRRLGADLHMPGKCVGFDFDGRRIRAALIEEPGLGTRRVESDYYLMALPVEAARSVLDGDMIRAAPTLSRLRELSTGWMTGVQLFLRKPLPLVRGHVAFDDTAWALSSVSQAQFWPSFNWNEYGDGQAREAFSVIISDWDTCGTEVVKKRAWECTPDEIFRETLAQLNTYLKRNHQEIAESDIVSWFLDPDILKPRGRASLDRNEEQLFITTTGAWSARPEPITEIPNLFVASDFVRSRIDFASAEGANEAARRAVNGILDRAGSKAARCRVWRQNDPMVTAPLRAFDRVLYALNLPAIGFWGATPFTQPPRRSAP
jgi:uncharacterized protein with NAD-binding domain and iron-sulfur cluster